jgi:hypothetical protein
MINKEFNVLNVILPSIQNNNDMIQMKGDGLPFI